MEGKWIGRLEDVMHAIRLLLPALLILSGCLSLGGGKGDNEALDTELAEMLKSYRKCLEKYEGDLAQRKERCEVYRKAVYDLAPKGSARLERESVKEQKLLP
jgi:hypothetical protein